MTTVSFGQIAVVVTAAACFLAATVASVLRLWSERPSLRWPDKLFAYGGLALSLGALVWHARQRGSWMPLEDNFDTLVSLGVLLAAFVLYVQVYRPIRGLDWFILPIVAGLLVAGAVFGRTKPHAYLGTAWSTVHRITAYGGAVAFAVACAAGSMFLIVNRRLKTGKVAGPGPKLGSLERLEHLTLVSVALGLGLLTIGAVTGLVKIAEQSGATQLGERWFVNPKILLALCVWVIYAVVLHSPINPSFRGRRAAVLSVVGFVLMIGTLIAVQFVPTR